MSSKTSDALEIIRNRYFATPDAARDSRAAAYRVALDIAEAVCDLREAAGLSVVEFSQRVGLSPEVVTDLEEADFDGDAFVLLQRIAGAMDREVRVQVVPRAEAA